MDLIKTIYTEERLREVKDLLKIDDVHVPRKSKELLYAC